MLNLVLVHVDVKRRPYSVERFRRRIDSSGAAADVVSLCSYQINRGWLITFKRKESNKLFESRKLLVKNRRCLVFKFNDRNVHLKVHWLPHHAHDRE